VRAGSILWLALQAGPAPRAFAAIDGAAAARYGELHPRQLDAGLWMAPSVYEVAFVSTVHGPEHVERAVAALDAALAALAAPAASGVPAR
jgi:glutamate-1-semialdehyde 2,1-aminomutase